MTITVIQTTSTEFILSRYQGSRGALRFMKGVRHQLIEDGGSVADILASWKSECQGDRIVLALPPGLLSLREIDLPLDDRKKGREILPFELKGEMASDAEEPVFEALPLSGGKTEAIWCKQELLATEIHFYTDKGFDPEVATFSMFSWHRLLPVNCSGVVAITDGEGIAVYLDGKPLYFRVLPATGIRPLDATITALELARGMEVATIFTLGSATIDSGLMLTPLMPGSSVSAAFPGDAAAVDLAPHYAMAQDLVDGDPVNMRRGALLFTKTRDQLRKKLRLTWALLGILLMLVFAEAAARYVLVKQDVTSLDSSIRTIYREVFPTRAKAVDEVAELKAEIRRLGGASGSGVLAVLKILAEAKGDDPHELYEIDCDGSQITGRGFDRSAQGVNDFKAKAARLFTGFEVSEIKSRPDGSVGFAFRGTLKGGGK